MELSIPPLQRTLSLDVSPDLNSLEPGGETSLTVVVKDADGNPVSDAELAVVAVDEAILALTNYQLQDPLSVFYASHSSYITSIYSRSSIILAARPSMGKTAFALNIAENVAVNEGLPVVVFSMEMGASQLALRMVGSLGRIDQSGLRTGRLRDDDWGRLTEAVDKLSKASIFIDETPALNFRQAVGSA